MKDLCTHELTIVLVFSCARSVEGQAIQNLQDLILFLLFCQPFVCVLDYSFIECGLQISTTSIERQKQKWCKAFNSQAHFQRQSHTSSTFTNSTTNQEASFQILQPIRDISHSNLHKIFLPSSNMHLYKVAFSKLMIIIRY